MLPMHPASGSISLAQQSAGIAQRRRMGVEFETWSKIDRREENLLRQATDGCRLDYFEGVSLRRGQAKPLA